MTLLSDNQRERLSEAAYRLSEEVGLRVKNDEIENRLLARGCERLASGRLRIPRELVDEVVAAQQARAANGERFWTPYKPIGKTGPEVVIPCAFSHGPTRFYDFEKGRSVNATAEHGDEMVRLAEAMPEVGRIQPFWVRGAHPEVETIERLVRALRLSPRLAPMDVMNPREIEYVMEIGEIVTGEPRSLQFILPGQCMTPPLTLCDIAARSYLELARLGARHTTVATMANMGVTAPVTLWGAVANALAEVLAGWVAVHAVSAEFRICVSWSTVSMDMASGQATMISPEMALLNAIGREFINGLIGADISHTGTQYGATATAPGFQVVCENLYMTHAVARLEGMKPQYLGGGQLASGGVGSPEQLMLDVEAARAMAEFDRPLPEMDDERLAIDEQIDVLNKGETFLGHEHTMAHFREMWGPRIARWDGAESGAERAALERAHDAWKTNRARYEPPDWSDDQLRAMDRVLESARKNLIDQEPSR